MIVLEEFNISKLILSTYILYKQFFYLDTVPLHER